MHGPDRWSFWVISCLIAIEASAAWADAPREPAPQAVSAVQINSDGETITVGTMAFSHESNVWQFGPDGSLRNQYRPPPFVPMQVATLAGGKSLAVGLAYSRVTSPEPTVWFGPAEALKPGSLRNEFQESDTRDSELARWRTGSGS